MDGDPGARGEHQLDAPVAQLPGQAVTVREDGGRLVAALGELDPIDLRGVQVSTSAPPRTRWARRRCAARAMSAGSARVQGSQPGAARCWKASGRRSGDQAGWVAGPGAAVSSISAVPSALAIHSVAWALRPCAGQRENASLAPSGEKAGRAS